MRGSRQTLLGGLFLCLVSTVTGQEPADVAEENATVYRMEIAGSAATGDFTPFWMTSNRYGVVPLDAKHGYLQAGVFHRQSFGKGFSWKAGLDMVAAVPRYRKVYIQQLYGELGYKCLLLSLGSKERSSMFLLDERLSTGDVILSSNARPIPEINLSMPQFTVIPWTKGWLQIKGDFAVGRSFDSEYLRQFANMKQTYIRNVLWHHKSGHLRIKDTRRAFPFALTLGVQHIAQWGGESTNPSMGARPHSFKDFLRVVFGKEGGEDATLSDQINVLGSHHISYDLRLEYRQKDWAIQGYYQRLCYDKSGMEFANGTDGLWGVQTDFFHVPWLKKVVLEYFTTFHQSGPFHFIRFDHDKYAGRGGGGDNYYNNEEYTTGNSYFNRGTGSPLLPAPEYNTDGSLGFQSNRVRDWHLGAEGNISAQVAYRLLLTLMDSRGTTMKPYLRKKTGVSGLVDISYVHPKLQGWLFCGSLAGDTGNVFGDKSFGFTLGIRKTGIIKVWD